MSAKFVLELKNISKSFPGVRALDKVCFTLKEGEIHALMGENGAGKSTLIKIITGVYQEDEGEILLNGKQITFANPKEAQKAGVVAIYQHVTSYPHLTVTENIFMAHEDTSRIIKSILWGKMHQKAQVLLDKLGADFNAQTIIGSLSVAQQQLVEIAKALSSNAKIIIMDEPTAALTKKESEELYKITEQLSAQGVSIIFVSHRFEDMYRLSSRVTVFRDAKYINTWDINDVNNKELIFAMVGREITQMYPIRTTQPAEVVLKVEHLSKIGYFTDINFEVRAGEILSFTGLVGAGRTEVFQALLGITDIHEGTIFINNKKVTISHPSEALHLGIGYLPEDRQLQGLILDWNILYNITLPNINELSRKGWLQISKEIEVSKHISEKVGVKASSVFDQVRFLSGGNQQKVVVAKLLTFPLKLIILDEPTKGVDIGAKSAIYHIMKNLVTQGYAVIMISSEMPEVLGISDRIVVMQEGRITKTCINEGITQEMILEAAMSTKSHITNTEIFA